MVRGSKSSKDEIGGIVTRIAGAVAALSLVLSVARSAGAVCNPDDAWDPQFHQFGTSGQVNAVAVSATGDVYIGGAFDRINNQTVNNIAKWDGNAWSALGTGVSATVNAILINGTDVYVGGTFTTAGGVS